MTGTAQEFFREYGTSRSSGGIGPVVASDYSYEDISPSELSPHSPSNFSDPTGNLSPNNGTRNEPNFAIGPIRFSIAAGLGVEFNDNINLSDKNRQSDIIFRPNLSIEATWQVTDQASLNFSIGAGYAKYLNHSEYDTDGLLLAPNSALEINFGLGNSFTVALRDRFSYQEDIFDVPVLSDEAKYGRYENQAGIEVQWDVNEKFRLNVGYDHYNLWTKEQIFNTQDRSIDTFFIKPSVELFPTVRVGINASYSYISFESDQRSDGSSLLVGPFIQWKVSDTVEAFLEGGYQRIHFEGSYQPRDLVDRFLRGRNFDSAQEEFVRNNATDVDTDDNSYYVRFEVSHDLSLYLKHRLSGSKTLEVGFFTNYYDIYHVEYSLDYKFNDSKTELSPTVFYEYYETSGKFGEEAHRVGAALGLRHYLSNSITLGLDYRFIYKDSNQPGFDYYQNLGFLSVYYKF